MLVVCKIFSLPKRLPPSSHTAVSCAPAAHLFARSASERPRGVYRCCFGPCFFHLPSPLRSPIPCMSELARSLRHFRVRAHTHERTPTHTRTPLPSRRLFDLPSARGSAAHSASSSVAAAPVHLQLVVELSAVRRRRRFCVCRLKPPVSMCISSEARGAPQWWQVAPRHTARRRVWS